MSHFVPVFSKLSLPLPHVIVLGNFTQLPQQDPYAQLTYPMLGNNMKAACARGSKLTFCGEQYLQRCESCSQHSCCVREDGPPAACSSFPWHFCSAPRASPPAPAWKKGGLGSLSLLSSDAVEAQPLIHASALV